MSKLFFRFLRGELNGFYLDNINETFNRSIEVIRKTLADFKRMQFKRDDEVTGDELPISASALQGLSIFAGIFAPFVYQDALANSIRFTQSHVVNGVERSERGLYKTEQEAFEFVRTAYDNYPNDINTEASSDKRSTFVEENRQPVGWFPEGERVFKDDGSLDLSKLIPAPRAGHADFPYWGDKFMYFAEEYPVRAVASNRVLVSLVKAMQWVRHNGVSVRSLAEFASILCPNFLFITNIDWEGHYAYGVVSYGIDENYEIEDKLMREQLFMLLINKKIPQMYFNKVQIDVTREADGSVISVETM
jgi:hypothetical protein